MEGATVSLALLLMAGALGLNVAIRSQFTSGVEVLQQQIAVQMQVHDAFDSTVLNFWRYYGSKNASLLAGYQHSDTQFRALTKQFADEESSEAQHDERRVSTTLRQVLTGFSELFMCWIRALPFFGQKFSLPKGIAA